MESWKQSLDHYLTSEPIDNFTPWVEKVIESFSNEFYKEAYEDRNDWENSETENNWLNKLYNRQEDFDYDPETDDLSPEKAAKIIERAYKFYDLKNYKFKR